MKNELLISCDRSDNSLSIKMETIATNICITMNSKGVWYHQRAENDGDEAGKECCA